MAPSTSPARDGPTAPPPATHWSDLARSILAGRKVVLVGHRLAAASEAVEQVRALGAADVLVVARGVGTGVPPSAAAAHQFVLQSAGDDILEEIVAYEAALADPPDDLAAALDTFDPRYQAVVWGTLYAPLSHVAGRQVIGSRRADWVAVERKVTVDALFDLANVTRAPSAVLSAVDVDGLHATSDRLDTGHGTVWSGDALAGPNGGGWFVRWVRTDADRRDAVAFFVGRCTEVRVAPFLRGVPCSVHGLVFEDHVAVFRPVEIVTINPTGTSRFHYGGTATFWDPPVADCEELRAAARRLGRTLREAAGSRGAFGVDGVLTADGFRPTELNARFAGGLETIAATIPSVPLEVIDRAVVEGIEADWRPVDLEARVVDAADATRGGAVHLLCDGSADTTTWIDTPLGRAAHGPRPGGTLLRLFLDPDRVPAGPTVAGPAVATLRTVADDLGVPAPAVDAVASATEA